MGQSLCVSAAEAGAADVCSVKIVQTQSLRRTTYGGTVRLQKPFRLQK